MTPLPSKKKRPNPGVAPPRLLGLLPKPPVGGAGNAASLPAAGGAALTTFKTLTKLTFSTCTLYVPLMTRLVQPAAADDTRGKLTMQPASSSPEAISVF